MNKEKKGVNGKAGYILREYGIFIILAALIIILSLLHENFMTVENIRNILRQVSIYAILAFGMTFVVISGGIDLSVGAILALCSCVAAILSAEQGMNIWVSAIIAICVGGLCGLANGFVIAKLKVPFFICTAGMMYIARGLALVITNESPVSGVPDEFGIFGGMPEWAVPPQVIIMGIVLVIFYIILRFTKLGRYTYAVGSSERSAKLSGINVPKQKIMMFFISGLTAGVCGVIMTSRLKSGNPNVADGYELDAIAAVAIGGTSMMGGSGSVIKSLVGALVLTVIRVGLNILGVSSSVQKVIIGIVIIVVVAIDMSNKGRKGD